MTDRLHSTDEDQIEPIAIVGMACRVPGAANLDEFWQNLAGGVESIRDLSEEEMLEAGMTTALIGNSGYVRRAPVLDGIEEFDAARFGFSRREAEILDPQHRLFLECSAAALEHAGCDPARYPGEIGVYAGAGAGEYGWYHLIQNKPLMNAVGHMAVALANNPDYLPTRVSYKLGLRGPSVSVHTACSTGLVAIHLACEAVRNGECDMALAGAASIELTQQQGYQYHEGGILSPDGHCRTFDADAQGTLWGSGAGIVVLKRLTDARADGDTVHAVILGSAINNDGADKVGFSAPSVSGQAEVISQALGVAGVDPASISYVEAHGTATSIGDPIEVTALNEVFGGGEAAPRSCGLGSVKPNIGHLAAAAGAVGLIKTVLSLQHETLPRTLHFQRAHPKIDFAAGPFRVIAENEEWPRGVAPRRAGVSSFGMGGTNAHAIVEEGDPLPSRASDRAALMGPECGSDGSSHAVLLSARTPSALETMAGELASHLERYPDADLADVAHTLQEGRVRYEHRRAVVGDDVSDVVHVLSGGAPRRLITGRAAERQTVFMFPGQGVQRVGMVRDLYEHEPVVREAIDRCADLLLGELGFDLRVVLFASESEAEEASRRLDDTVVTQPALFAVEYALAQLWIERGVTPDAMIGHSLGEYVAACVAGVFDLETAVSLVAARASLMGACPPGEMVAVHCDEAELGDLAGRQLSLAAVNAPSACTVSGPSEAITTFAAELEEIGVPVTRLRTSHAFHSAMMEPARAGLAALLARAELNPPAIPIVSNVTGEWLTAEQATSPDYWTSHMCLPVRFGEGLRRAISETPSVLLEVGPGATLTGLARLQLTPATPDPIVSLDRGARDERSAVLQAMSRLWALGVEVSWNRADGGAPRRIPLPGHPFERERCWIEEPEPAAASAAPALNEGKLPLEEWFSIPGWRQTPPAPPDPAPGGPWLMFADERGIAAGLAERLRSRGEHVVTVTAGDERRFGVDGHVIRPAEAADYEELLDVLQAEGALPATIVHAWCVGRAGLAIDGLDGLAADVIDRLAADGRTGLAAGALDASATARTIELGLSSLVLLAQSLAGRDLAADRRLEVITSDAQDVTGADLLHPAAATVTAACRVFPLEFPGLACRVIDVALDAAGGSAAAAVKALSEELAAVPAGDTVVAHRAGKRWVETLEPMRIEADAAARASLRDGGVYVITGGLGGIGLSIADELARRVRAKLVLVGRSPLPPRGEWDSLSRGTDRQARRVARVRAIEALGAEVLALTADVADPAEMARVRDQAIERFGAVHGVIHAAGIAGGTLVEAQAPEIAAAVLEPKIAGTLAVARVFDDSALDFLVLCSSVTAVAGGIGQLDYCAGNAFMDAFARSRAGTGAPVLSLNWGGWLEVGMAVETDAPAGFRNLQRGVRPVDIAHPLLDSASRVEEEHRLTATVFLDAATHWALDEHRIQGVPVLPGTGFLELARAAFDRDRGGRPVELRDVVFVAPLAVPDGERREVRVVIQDDEAGSRFRVESLSGGGWKLHARGAVGWASTDEATKPDLEAIRARCPRRREDEAGEESASGMLTFGPRWSSLKRVWAGEGEELALLEAGPDVAAELAAGSAGSAERGGYVLHPALLDEATSFGDFAGEGGQYLPLGYSRMEVHAPMPERVYSHVRHREPGAGGIILCDITLLDTAGALVAEIGDFMLRRVDAEAFGSDAEDQAGEGTGDEVGILPAEGAEAMLRVLSAPPAAQVVVSALAMPTLIASVKRLNLSLVGESLPQSELGEPGAGAVAPTEDYVAPTTDLERTLAALWEDITGTREIGTAHDFFEVGGNSLVAVQLMSRVRAATGVKLPMRSLFESPTIAAMAAAIEACGLVSA